VEKKKPRDRAAFFGPFDKRQRFSIGT